MSVDFLLCHFLVNHSVFPFQVDMISRKNGFDFRARKTFVEKLLAAVGAPEIQPGTRNCPKIY